MIHLCLLNWLSYLNGIAIITAYDVHILLLFSSSHWWTLAMSGNQVHNISVVYPPGHWTSNTDIVTDKQSEFISDNKKRQLDLAIMSEQDQLTRHDHLASSRNSPTTTADGDSDTAASTNWRNVVSVSILFVVNLLNYMDRFTVAGKLKVIRNCG